MATPKLSFKTPLLPINWVNIEGQGKLKRNKDSKSTDSKDYNYTATVTYPDKAAMEVDKAIFDKFWRENKPAGLTKQNYTMFKPERVPTLDEAGKEQKDADDAIIKHETGRWTLAAKTLTQWPDGKPNIVKVLRANGQPLNLGGKTIGEGSVGILHGSIGINAFAGNEGLAFYLDAVQLKKFVEYSRAGEVHADDLGDDEGMDDLDMDVADVSDNAKPEV